MGIASYIRIIGRGARGARPLDRAQALDLMSQLLDGRLSDLEIGAFALAMRIKGEAPEELDGFFEAVSARGLVLETPRPAILLPSYNGARKRPNLTPLLAATLAQRGVPVLVHGPTEDASRIGSASLFRSLGWPIVGSSAEAQAAWKRREPVFMPIEALHPPLARLLDVRRVVGVRNSGHTLAKLLDPLPGSRSLRVVNHTHPDYAGLLAGFLQREQADALLLRGTEGEPYADPRRFTLLEVYRAGVRDAALSRPAEEWPEPPSDAAPPTEFDADSTARYTERVLAGQALLPPPLARQVEVLLAAVDNAA